MSVLFPSLNVTIVSFFPVCRYFCFNLKCITQSWNASHQLQLLPNSAFQLFSHKGFFTSRIATHFYYLLSFNVTLFIIFISLSSPTPMYIYIAFTLLTIYMFLKIFCLFFSMYFQFLSLFCNMIFSLPLLRSLSFPSCVCFRVWGTGGCVVQC